MVISNKQIMILILFSLSFLLSANFCYAGAPLNLKNAFGEPLKTVAEKGAGYNTSLTADSFISQVITIALSFIGVLFLLLAIYGGYIWMLARGNEQEVEKAKQIIQNAIIGLVVVLAAYAISWYVINALGATTLKEAGPELVAPNIIP